MCRIVVVLALLLGFSSPFAAAAEPERVYLYGGPGSIEGRFENQFGSPDWQDWTSHDLSDQEFPLWQISTFNAENLNSNGPGNTAMWCGRTAEQEPGWADAPGYGNGWDASIQWTSEPLDDPSAGQTLALDFFFNQESEPNYDYFTVEYDSAGQWNRVLEYSGTNKDPWDDSFPAPGLQFSTLSIHPPTRPIVFAGNDYSTDGRIRIRIRFTSDGAFSDEGGLFPTVAGAAQVDDITVSWVDNGVPHTSFEDFEGIGPHAWRWQKLPFRGDFAKILGCLTDIDPCRENRSPQMTFIDDGSSPNNAPGETTGGSLSTLFHYGKTTENGSYTMNFTGGLLGEGALENEVRSPILALDRPGPDDDGPGWRTWLEYTSFYHSTAISLNHFPLARSSSDGGVTWSAWKLFNSFIFFAPGRPGYYDHRLDISTAIAADATHVQVALRAYDPSDRLGGVVEATPAPWFDDVAVYKVETGTTIEIEPWDRPSHAFPTAAGTDVSTPAARDQLDVAILSPGLNSAAPSIYVRVHHLEPSTSVPEENVRLVWVLDKNPLFEDAIRNIPPAATTVAAGALNGWDQWRGEFGPTSSGNPRSYQSDYAFQAEIPSADFLYPGDVLRWHIEVTSNEGPVATHPSNLDGFASGKGWSEDFTLRALPTFLDDTGATPPILVVDNTNGSGEDRRVLQALTDLGYTAGVDYDFTRTSAFRTHDRLGAGKDNDPSAAQLEIYDTIVSLERADGEVDAPWMDAWLRAGGKDRLLVIAGRKAMGTLAVHSPEGLPFLQNTLGVDYLGSGGLAGTGGETFPFLAPTSPSFAVQLLADTSCHAMSFDEIDLQPGAVQGHTISGPGGSVVGSVLNSGSTPDGYAWTTVALPVSLFSVGEVHAKAPIVSARAQLLAEIFALNGAPIGGGVTPVPRPGAPGLFALRASPNPFNPATMIRFDLGVAGDATVRLLNVRGEVVRRLHEGRLEAGSQALRWDGRDDGGSSVASGVYYARVEANGELRSLKLALLK